MNIFAIIQKSDRAVRRIRIQQDLQTQLTNEFQKQRDTFLNDANVIDFDPRYRVDEDEIFVLHDFVLPDFITSATKNINQVDKLKLSPDTKIKSIFAVEYHEEHPENFKIYFQGFMKRRLLVDGFTLLQGSNTYQRMKDPGLILDTSLDAIFEQGNSLYFRNFTIVNRFLDLTPHFVEATDNDIREVLSDNKLQVEDDGVIIELSDAVMRKKFMAVKSSKILERVTVTQIAKQAKNFSVKLKIEQNRIIFPGSKKEAKELLRLLLEGYYEGPLTGNKFITNSQRPI